MNKTISEYVKTCDNDILKRLNGLILAEINRRKEIEKCHGSFTTEE